MIRGCEFREDKKQISLEAGIKRAILTDNLAPGKLRIDSTADPSVVKRDGD